LSKSAGIDVPDTDMTDQENKIPSTRRFFALSLALMPDDDTELAM
jgi:hypothetical protein